MKDKSVFVTVGTTKFPKLIEILTTKSVVDVLLKLGYTSVQVQTGKDFKEVNIDEHVENTKVYKENNSTVLSIDSNIIFKYDEYFENFEEQILKADLVISHAGAGSCLEVLRKNKPLLVVINEDLMNNHQTELAEQLQENQHLYYCTCETLADGLQKNFNKLKPYPKPNQHLFSNYLDQCCGFAQ